MKVVANGIVLNKTKKLDIFELDLGTSVINQKTGTWDIKDSFIYKYFTMTGKYILKYGKIGKLGFYQDFTLPEREYIIFNNEKLYNVIYDENDEKLEMEEHLAKIIQEIEEIEDIDMNEEQKIQKAKVPDIKLSKDQYIAEMIKKRKK